MTNVCDFTETRHLCYEDLIRLLKKYKLYTYGNDEDYTNLLDICKAKNITTRLIVNMASNIAYHSRLDINHTFSEHISNICYLISKECFSLFKKSNS